MLRGYSTVNLFFFWSLQILTAEHGCAFQQDTQGSPDQNHGFIPFMSCTLPNTLEDNHRPVWNRTNRKKKIKLSGKKTRKRPKTAGKVLWDGTGTTEESLSLLSLKLFPKLQEKCFSAPSVKNDLQSSKNCLIRRNQLEYSKFQLNWDECVSTPLFCQRRSEAPWEEEAHSDDPSLILISVNLRMRIFAGLMCHEVSGFTAGEIAVVNLKIWLLVCALLWRLQKTSYPRIHKIPGYWTLKF